VLCRERGIQRVHVIANMVRSPVEGRALYDKLARVVEKFLPEASLAYLGAIPQDDALRRAVQKQKPVVEAFPSAQASAAFRELAGRIHRWARATTPRGHIEFFVERMLEAGGARA
jgi:flagellar biosynthesis protein FlhG